MRFGQPDMHWHESRLGPKTEKRKCECNGCPERRQGSTAHRIQRELPTSTLHYAEAEQDTNRAEVRHQQIEKSCAPDFRDPVLRGDEEVRGQGHRLPGHHEEISIVGQHHHGHAGEKHVVVQAEQTRRSAFATTEIPRSKSGNPGTRQAKNQKEESRKRIQPQMEWKVRQSQRQCHHFGRVTADQKRSSQEKHAQTQYRSYWKQKARNVTNAVRPEQAGNRNHRPASRDEKRASKRVTPDEIFPGSTQKCGLKRSLLVEYAQHAPIGIRPVVVHTSVELACSLAVLHLRFANLFQHR